MKRVFLDANTLISGIVFSGPEHQLLKLGIRKQFELVTSEDVIEEIVEVINRKFPEKAFLVKEFLQLAEIKVIRRKDYGKLVERQKVRDAEDKHVLAAAFAAKSDVLVTGDKDLLVLKKHGQIAIRTTKELLANSS